MAPRKKADEKSAQLAAGSCSSGRRYRAGISNAALVMGVDDGQPDWLLGQFDVKAKSPAGFLRCQVHFLHSSPTRVFVVSDKANVPHDHDCELPCCYLTQEEAKRVYGDPWLKVLIDSEVIKD